MTKKRVLLFSLFFLIFSNIIFAQLKEDPAFEIVRNQSAEELSKVWKDSFKDIRDSKGRSLLHEAAYSGKEKIVSFLISKGINVNLTDPLGWTALHEAVLKENTQAVQVLLKSKNINVNAQTTTGKSPLSLAVQKGNLSLVKLILENHANINITDINGWTVLHHAAHNSYNEILNYLIKNSITIDKRDDLGKTALYIAASVNNEKAVTLLIERGANVNSMDYTLSDPKRPLDVAGSDSIKQFLKVNGAKRGKSPFLDGIMISPEYRYQGVIDDMDIQYVGVRIDWYLDYRISFFWNFSVGKGENDFNYYRFPASLMAIYSLGTGWGAWIRNSYDDNFTNSKKNYYWALAALSMIFPEGMAYHMYLNNRNYHLALSPYVSWASVDFGKKGSDYDIIVGIEAGLALDYYPIRNLKISPGIGVKLTYAGDFGYFVTFNIGYLF